MSKGLSKWIYRIISVNVVEYTYYSHEDGKLHTTKDADSIKEFDVVCKETVLESKKVRYRMSLKDFVKYAEAQEVEDEDEDEDEDEYEETEEEFKEESNYG